MTEAFSLYGNPLRPADAQKAADWQQMFMRKFSYDPGERYDLSLVDNECLQMCGVGDRSGMGQTDARKSHRGSVETPRAKRPNPEAAKTCQRACPCRGLSGKHNGPPVRLNSITMAPRTRSAIAAGIALRSWSRGLWFGEAQRGPITVTTAARAKTPFNWSAPEAHRPSTAPMAEAVDNHPTTIHLASQPLQDPSSVISMRSNTVEIDAS